MLNLDWHVHEVDGATLVEAVVESSAPTPRRVRIETTLDGPVWPPRRDGVPERGWDGDCFEGVVPADGRLALGFASPAPAVEPPVYVVDHERTDDGDVTDTDPGRSAGFDRPDRPTGPNRSTRPDRPSRPEQPNRPDRPGLPNVTIPERTPAGVLRALGSPTPPRDAIPDPVARDAVSDPTSRNSSPVPASRKASPAPTSRNGSPAPTSRSDSSDHATDGPRPAGTVPDAVADWLLAIEGRVQRAEALADAGRLTDAARELDRVGGLADAERLVDSLERDERALRRVAERAALLADRCATADVPLSALHGVT